MLRESLTLPGIGQVDSATREHNLQYLRAVGDSIDVAVAAMVEAITRAIDDAGTCVCLLVPLV